MTKTILLTGATDGIGLETARHLRNDGHHLLLHGRNVAKLEAVAAELSGVPGAGTIETYVADMSDLSNVAALAEAVSASHTKLDVIINNAGVFKTKSPVAANGIDVRFVVNTHAPYLLTKRLLPLMESAGRVVNIASAAQAPVSNDALNGRARIVDDFSAYAQSKLAIIMWTRVMADDLGSDGPVVVAVNPGSLLGTKMVKEGFGTSGNSIAIGVDIITRAALSAEFVHASGAYFDNDIGRFAPPHADALNSTACDQVVAAIEIVLTNHTQ